MNEADIARWLDELGNPRKAIQRPAAEALGDVARADDAVRARLVALLGDEERRRRWGAAYALARLEPLPVETIPVLLDALASPDGDLRWASARILVRAAQESTEVVGAIRGLLGAPAALARKMGLYCLRDLGPAAAVPIEPIARALDDADASVRLAAMAAIAALHRGPEAARHVTDRLADLDAGVRRAAAATLGQLGVHTDAIARALSAAADSDDVALARAARAALSRLGVCPASP